MKRLDDLAQRRALLVSRCELDRLELALAWHDVRRALDPDDPASAVSRPWLRRALGMATPLLGAARVGRASRVLSYGLFAWRVATGLRGRRR